MTHANVSEARSAAIKAHHEWWTLYVKDRRSEETKKAKEEADKIRAEILSQFGVKNPKYPDCKQCIEFSVFGGPGHEASPNCRSGKRPHCTCDTCF